MKNEECVRVIADLTSTRWGLETSIVRLMKRYCDEYNVDKSTLSILVTAAQRQYMTPDFAGATILVLRTEEVRGAIMELVRSGNQEGAIRLLSYGRDVLELEREDSRIKALSFGRYRQASRTSKQQMQRDTAAGTPVSIGSSETPIVEAAQGSPAEPDVKKPVYRSEVFQAILIKRHLGPFSDHRPLVYNAIEGLIGSGVKVRVSELFRRALKDAKVADDERNKASGRVSRVDDRLWAGIAKFSEQLFLEAKALIGPDGEALGTDWKSRCVPVDGLAPDWRAKCDGLLILGLVDEGEVISSVEAKNLSRAIYHSATEESEDRVNEAVLYLLKERIVEETTEGLRRVRPSSEARLTPRLVG